MKNKQEKTTLNSFKFRVFEIVKNVSRTKNPVIITYKGESKVILQDINEYKRTQDALALLTILSLSSKNIDKKKARTIRETFKEIRKEFV